MPRCAVALRSCFQNGMVVAWHGRSMACVNEKRLHCVNQMGRTQSKPLAARSGGETARARHGNGMCTALYVWFSRKSWNNWAESGLNFSRPGNLVTFGQICHFDDFVRLLFIFVRQKPWQLVLHVVDYCCPKKITTHSLQKLHSSVYCCSLKNIDAVVLKCPHLETPNRKSSKQFWRIVKWLRPRWWVLEISSGIWILTFLKTKRVSCT
jgi:hypothetical protein